MATRDQVYIDIITETKKSIGGLKNLAIGLAAAYAAFKTVQQIAKKALDAAMYAAKVDQIRRSFTSLAEGVGQDANIIIADLDRLAGGTINKLDLLTSASRAALFKLPMDKMDDLMKIARASATATGESVKYMFDSIVLGIARGSPKILDNLGILIKAEKATADYAASIGKTAEELTAAEKTQATMNAVLAAGEEIMRGVGAVAQETTDAERWQVLQAAVVDLKEEIGTGLLPVFRETTKQATKFVEKLTEIAKINRILAEVSSGIASLENELFLVNKQLAEYEITIEKSGAAAEAYTQMVAGEIRQLEARRDVLARTIAAIQYKEALQKSAEEAEKKRLAELERLREEAAEKERKRLEKIWQGWQQLDSTIEPVIDEIVAGFQESSRAALGLTDIMSGFYDELAGREPVIKDTIKEVENLADAFDRLRHAEEYVNQTFIDMDAELKEKKDEMSILEKYIESLGDTAKLVFQDTFESLGEALVGMEDAWDSLGNMMREVTAKGLEALGQEALVRAAAAFASGFVDPKMFAAAAAWGAAAALAFTGAGVVRGLAEGGIVTQPTLAYLGESGPEAVVPLSKSKMGMGRSVVNHFHIQGSLITEDELMRKAAQYVYAAAKGF